MEYMCTKFGVDSSVRFPFRALTHPNTDGQRLDVAPPLRTELSLLLLSVQCRVSMLSMDKTTSKLHTFSLREQPPPSSTWFPWPTPVHAEQYLDCSNVFRLQSSRCVYCTGIYPPNCQIPRPHLYIVPRVHPCHHAPKRHLDCFSIFAGLTIVTNGQTDRQTDMQDEPRHVTCNNMSFR